MAIKLGKNTFVVPPPTGMQSFALQQRLIPVVSRVVEVLVHLLGSTGVKGPEDLLGNGDVLTILPQAMPYLGRIFSDMPRGELEYLTRELLRDAKFDGMPLFNASGDAFDALMAGRNLDTWRLLGHAVEVWYPDFFALAGLLRAKEKPASPSTESTTSIPSTPASAS